MAVVLLGTPVTTFAEDEVVDDHDTVTLTIIDPASSPSLGYVASSLRFSDFLPGSVVRLSFNYVDDFSPVISGITLPDGSNLFAGSFCSVPISETSVSVDWTVPEEDYSYTFYASLAGVSSLPWGQAIDLTVGGASQTLSLGDIKFCAHEDCRPTLEVISGAACVAVSAFDVSSGSWTVTPVAEGEATLKLSTGGVTNWTGTVTVDAGSVPVTGVTLSDTTKSLKVDETFKLTAAVTPEGATDPTVTWESSDENVATVDADGVVTAVGPGEATITVSTEDGNFTDTCTVTVQDSNDGAPGIPPDDGDDGGLPAVDRSTWGAPSVRSDGRTQYVVDDPASPAYGMTSVELSSDSAYGSGYGAYFWLREESDSSSAWYALSLDLAHSDLLDKGYRFYVRWLSSDDTGYEQLYSLLDDKHKARIEGEKAWIFDTGILDANGAPIQPPSPVELLVQIGDDWDLSDLQAYFIASGDDESVPISVLNNFKFPGGNDEFGKMTLSHFSPYIIFDELIHSDKPVLTPTPNSDSGEPNRSDSAPPVTGDLSIELLISSLAIVLVFALGIMLRMLKSKRKFEE